LVLKAKDCDPFTSTENWGFLIHIISFRIDILSRIKGGSRGVSLITLLGQVGFKGRFEGNSWGW